MSRKSLSDRMIVEIILKHKEKIIKSTTETKKIENEINEILAEFIKKTGRDIHQIKITKENDQYKLLLEIK